MQGPGLVQLEGGLAEASEDGLQHGVDLQEQGSGTNWAGAAGAEVGADLVPGPLVLRRGLGEVLLAVGLASPPGLGGAASIIHELVLVGAVLVRQRAQDPGLRLLVHGLGLVQELGLVAALVLEGLARRRVQGVEDVILELVQRLVQGLGLHVVPVVVLVGAVLVQRPGSSGALAAV